MTRLQGRQVFLGRPVYGSECRVARSATARPYGVRPHGLKVPSRAAATRLFDRDEGTADLLRLLVEQVERDSGPHADRAGDFAQADLAGGEGGQDADLQRHDGEGHRESSTGEHAGDQRDDNGEEDRTVRLVPREIGDEGAEAHRQRHLRPDAVGLLPASYGHGTIAV